MNDRNRSDDNLITVILCALAIPLLVLFAQCADAQPISDPLERIADSQRVFFAIVMYLWAATLVFVAVWLMVVCSHLKRIAVAIEKGSQR